MILILSTSTGGGHNQVARVIGGELSGQGVAVEQVDFLVEAGRVLNSVVAKGYNRWSASPVPWFGALYRASNHKKANRCLVRLIYQLLGASTLAAISSRRPQAIVATHPIIVNVVGELKARRAIDMPLLAVVTDFDAHWLYVNPFVDAYVTGCEEAASSLVKKGVPRQKIYNYGIPVRREFYTWRTRSKGQFTVLVMGGSQGTGRMKDTVKALLACPFQLKVVCVCGNNENLARDIKRLCQHPLDGKQVEVIGFTREIPALMDTADILFTKPGGVTVSEAIVKGLPIVIPYSLPGQEVYNTRVLLNHGIAMRIKTPAKATELVAYLFSQPGLLEDMTKKMQAFSSSYSLDSTISLIEQMAGGQPVPRKLPVFTQPLSTV